MTIPVSVPFPHLYRSTNLFRSAWAFNRLLTLAVLLHLAIIPFLLLGMVVDPKTITGVNAWIKPLKFALSGAIYGATFLWMLTLVRGRRRWVQLTASVTGAALLVETGLITMQVVRNVPSHFNATSAFDGIVFSIMGAFILLLALANLAIAVLLLFQKLPDPIVAWSVRWALIISLAGMGAGVLMTAGNLPPSQVAAAQAGAAITITGAHSVGVEDGGPGLPILGWSTVGGDLRVGHFVGLHGLQVLPLFAFLLTRTWLIQRLDRKRRLALVWTAGLSYLTLTLLLIWQAMRAQPLIAPDVTTGTALTVWFVLSAGMLLLLALPALRHRTSQDYNPEIAAATVHWS